jgi:regulator of RNase E activity RraA
MDQTQTPAAATLTTPMISDACRSLNLPVRAAPFGIRALIPGQRLYGRVFPVRHYGDVDIFLEAITLAETGDVLVIDNGGRLDEACIGDLVTLEAQLAGLSGIALWGAHRDTAEIIEMNFPVFSSGAFPVGPQRHETRDANPFGVVSFGDCRVSREDVIFGDQDGVLFLAAQHLPQVIEAAQSIQEMESRQAERARGGNSLRQQFQFDSYLSERGRDPAYTFRLHLKRIRGAI